MPKTNLKILKVDTTSNYHRVRFVDPETVTDCKVPAWAITVAESVSKDAKVTMCQKDGGWGVQSVLITKKFHDKAEARRLALKIAQKIEGSDKKVPKKWAGGNLEGPSHSEGGITVEMEGGEGVLMVEVMNDPEVRTYMGTNREIANMMQLNHGGNPMMEKGGVLNYRISEGYDHKNNYPLYHVSGIDNEYVGEWHTKKSDAKKELDSLIMAGGGTITPYKEVSASQKKSIEEVLTLPQYSNLNTMEAGILFSKFRDYENLEVIEGEP